MRYGGDGMRRDGRGLDGWDDDPGRMMRHIRNQGGSKRGDENRHQAGSINLLTQASLTWSSSLSKVSSASPQNARVNSSFTETGVF